MPFEDVAAIERLAAEIAATHPNDLLHRWFAEHLISIAAAVRMMEYEQGGAVPKEAVYEAIRRVRRDTRPNGG